MSTVRVDLLKLDANTRQHALQELAGRSFKLGAEGKDDPDRDCPLPRYMRASIAESMGVAEGEFLVPTMAAYEAAVTEAAEAKHREASDNPWRRERWNITRQIEISRDDPAAAARMKLAAGVR